jgi:hypothetical protein
LAPLERRSALLAQHSALLAQHSVPLGQRSAQPEQHSEPDCYCQAVRAGVAAAYQRPRGAG